MLNSIAAVMLGHWVAVTPARRNYVGWLVAAARGACLPQEDFGTWYW